MAPERVPAPATEEERKISSIRAAVIARIWVLLASTIAIGSSIASGKGCESNDAVEEKTASGFVTYSLEEHINRGESAGKTAEFKAQSIEIAEQTKKAIDDSEVQENSHSLEDAQKILQEEGGEGRLMEPSESDKKHVYHSGLDMYPSTSDFIELKNWWAARGEDYFKETIVPHIKPDGTQELDQQGHPMFLPSLFDRDIHEIYEKTGVWLNVRWGIRDFNARLVVWGRSLQSCIDNGKAVKVKRIGKKLSYYKNKLMKNRAKLEEICSQAVKEDVAGKPKTPGNGHLAMDIDGWHTSKAAYDMLVEKGYIGGCESGLYPRDARHFGPTTIKITASKKNKCLKEHTNLR